MRFHSLNAYVANTAVSQEALAKAVQVSQATISRILSGKQRPSPKLALALSQLTGIPIENLLFPPKYARRKKDE